MPRKISKQLVVQAAVDAMADATAAGGGSGTTVHSTAPGPVAPVGRGSGAASSSGGAHLLTYIFYKCFR